MKSIIEQFKFLKQDYKRRNVKSLKDFFYLIFEQGFIATVLFRLRRALFLIDIPIIKIVLRLIGFFIFKFTEIFLGVSIPSMADIGPGLYIGHTGSVFLFSTVKAGKNLSIGQGITIGVKGPGYKDQAPVIGDNVYIGVGSKVLGEIKIGNNVKIGANAVVLIDIPDNATAVGVPAKVIKISSDLPENTL